jgi:hypothetical protein
MWITALNTSGVDKDNLPVDEPKQYRSALGGYAPYDKAKYAKKLVDAIIDRRIQALPEAELDRRAEVTNRKELAQKAKKKKAAPVPRPVTPDVVVEDASWTEVSMRKHLKTKAQSKRPEGCNEPFSDNDDDDSKAQAGPSVVKRMKEDKSTEEQEGYYTRSHAAQMGVKHEIEDEFADASSTPVPSPNTDELLGSDDENNND